MNWRVFVGGVVVIMALLTVLALGFGQDPHAVPSVRENLPAPGFQLADINAAGATVSLAQFAGRPVLINFWATWCTPCQAEHELLQAAAQHYAGRVQFLGIVYQDDAANAKQYLARRSNHFPQLLDVDSRTAIDYGVSGVPESFVIAPDGTLVHKEPGVFTEHALVAALAQAGVRE